LSSSSLLIIYPLLGLSLLFDDPPFPPLELGDDPLLTDASEYSKAYFVLLEYFPLPLDEGALS